MGSGSSCLHTLPETWPLAKIAKKKSRIITVKAKESSKEVKVCKYCHCRNEECRIRNAHAKSHSGTFETFRTVKCGTGNESIFVDNTDFPYHRPKTIRPVKPFMSDETIPFSDTTSSITTQNRVPGDDFSSKPIYGFHPYQNLQRLTISEPTAYLHGSPPQHQRLEELTRSASYNPSVGYGSRPVGTVLPHRTVERLKSTKSYRVFHETYPSEIFADHIIQATPSTKRPPTPVPWYPTERTNDYLAASSLLAAEQSRERQRQS